MIVTAWNNGSHNSSGAGYGFRFNASDRDHYIDRSWGNVFIELPDGSCVEANIDKDSWDEACYEIIKIEFGVWLLENKYAPWPEDKPPKFKLTPISGNHFKLSEI